MPKKERILIVSDLEGASGKVTEKMVNDLSAVKNLAKDINAVIEGITKKTDDIFIWDFHGKENNISPNKIKHKVKFLRLPSFKKIKEFGFDKVLLVGFHSRASLKNEFIPHTYSNADVKSFKLNDTYIGEATLFVYLFSEINVPIVFISGSQAAVKELKKLKLNFKSVTTRKKKTSVKVTARSFSSAAAQAMEIKGKILKSRKYTFQINLFSDSLATVFANTGKFKKIFPFTVAAKSTKFSEIYIPFVNTLFKEWKWAERM